MTIKSTHQSKLRHPSLFAYLRAGCKIPPREICGTPPIPATTTTRVATPDTHMGLGDVMQNLKQICSPTEKQLEVREENSGHLQLQPARLQRSLQQGASGFLFWELIQQRRQSKAPNCLEVFHLIRFGGHCFSPASCEKQ